MCMKVEGNEMEMKCRDGEKEPKELLFVGGKGTKRQSFDANAGESLSHSLSMMHVTGISSLPGINLTVAFSFFASIFLGLLIVVF